MLCGYKSRIAASRRFSFLPGPYISRHAAGLCNRKSACRKYVDHVTLESLLRFRTFEKTSGRGAHRLKLEFPKPTMAKNREIGLTVSPSHGNLCASQSNFVLQMPLCKRSKPGALATLRFLLFCMALLQLAPCLHHFTIRLHIRRGDLRKSPCSLIDSCSQYCPHWLLFKHSRH